MELTPFLFGAYKLAKYALYPLSWICGLVLITTLLALLPASPDRHRWIRRLSVWTLLLLGLTVTPLMPTLAVATLESWYPPFTPDSGSKFDAIVVLAGGAHARGTLRPTDELSGYSRERTLCGADYYLQGLAPILVLSGGSGGVFGPSPKEAPQMKRYAHRLGVPEGAMVVEDQSRTTYENAVYTKQRLESGSILLVTSASHLPRAVALFTKQGFRVTAAPCGYHAKDSPGTLWQDVTILDLFPTFFALEQSTHAVTEVAGIIVYWIAGKL